MEVQDYFKAWCCKNLTPKLSHSSAIFTLSRLEEEGNLDAAFDLGNRKVAEQLTDVLAHIQATTDPATIFALIIDGKALAHALNPQNRRTLVQARERSSCFLLLALFHINSPAPGSSQSHTFL